MRLSHQTELLGDNDVLNVALEWCQSELRSCTSRTQNKSAFFKRGFDEFIAGGTWLQCLHFSCTKYIL